MRKSNTHTSAEPANANVAPRRSVLRRIWGGLLLLFGLELGWGIINILRSRTTGQATDRSSDMVEAGNIERFKPGSVTPVPQGRLYIARLEDGGFLALSSACTHLGCSLPWDETKRLFICPCHGSTFDLAGNALSAPAPRALDMHPLRIENGQVRVDISKRIRRARFESSQAVRI